MIEKSRFALVTAAHHFLIEALPFRVPESKWALETFIAAIQHCNLSAPDVDAVLLRCLSVLNEHADQRIPSLIDRYLADASTVTDGVGRFAKCVEEVLKYRGIRDGTVQQAIDIVSTRYSEPTLTPQRIARDLQLRLSTMCAVFKRETGSTVREYVRSVRLGRAAALLATTTKSIKEVWSGVGYNHPSNFDHDFKQRFNLSPRQYRSFALLPATQALRGLSRTEGVKSRNRSGPRPNTRVLIVDDDECTRRTISRYLELEGYTVSLATSGAEGLREVKSTSPDAILLDYRLDDMDGLEFLRALRQMSNSNTPAVALFTADWDIVDHTDEVHSMHATIASKLCDLNVVGALVSQLLPGTVVGYFDM